MQSERDATLAVLAGGESTRMGQPKSLLRIAHQPILRFLLDRLQWHGPKWLVTAPGKESPPGAEAFDRELADPQSGLGPMRGILTALESVQTGFLIVATGDMPLVESLHLLRLLNQLRDDSTLLGVMFRTNGGPEPFPLALRRDAIGVVRSRLQSGRTSVRRLLQERGFSTIAPMAEWDQRMWTNLNEPQDLDRLVASLGPSYDPVRQQGPGRSSQRINPGDASGQE